MKNPLAQTYAQAQALAVLCKPERLTASVSKDGFIALENPRSRSIEFKDKNTNNLMGFLWGKVRNKQHTIFESQHHRIVVSAFVVDDRAIFTLELHIKTEPNVYKVENLVPTASSEIQKTTQAKLPQSVLAILNLNWFRELRVMLRKFNQYSMFSDLAT